MKTSSSFRRPSSPTTLTTHVRRVITHTLDRGAVDLDFPALLRAHFLADANEIEFLNRLPVTALSVAVRYVGLKIATVPPHDVVPVRVRIQSGQQQQRPDAPLVVILADSGTFHPLPTSDFVTLLPASNSPASSSYVVKDLTGIDPLRRYEGPIPLGDLDLAQELLDDNGRYPGADGVVQRHFPSLASLFEAKASSDDLRTARFARWHDNPFHARRRANSGEAERDEEEEEEEEEEDESRTYDLNALFRLTSTSDPALEWFAVSSGSSSSRRIYSLLEHWAPQLCLRFGSWAVVRTDIARSKSRSSSFATSSFKSHSGTNRIICLTRPARDFFIDRVLRPRAEVEAARVLKRAVLSTASGSSTSSWIEEALPPLVARVERLDDGAPRQTASFSFHLCVEFEVRITLTEIVTTDTGREREGEKSSGNPGASSSFSKRSASGTGTSSSSFFTKGSTSGGGGGEKTCVMM